jgi:hypothetical protein
MKVIFLDIDGVLNNSSCWSTRPISNSFAKECVEAFNDIIIETNADIVISSSWRTLFKFDELIDILSSAGVAGNIIDKTPVVRFSGGRRGDEIVRWLDRASEEVGFKIERFVILDDDSDMGHLMDHLIQCDPETGLTKDDAQKVIRMLNK